MSINVIFVSRIGAEERKLVLAQRKLESIRVLDELISRAKVIPPTATRLLKGGYYYSLRGLLLLSLKGPAPANIF